MSTPIAYTMTARNKHTLAVYDAHRGVLLRTHTVQGDIVSINLSGATGNVLTKQGPFQRMHVFDLQRGALARSFSVA